MKKLLLAAAIIALTPLPAMADRTSYKPSNNPTFKKECGACHMAFQPGFLPANSWELIMDDLGNHFGEDASLDDETTSLIKQYLVKKAARRVSGEPPLRITRLRWFVREHNHEVSSRAKKKAGTMSNCTSCHRGAERGYFDDD